MKYTEKKILFDAFLLKWEFKFQKIPSILNYISHYHALFPRNTDINFIEIKELYETQLQWVSLVDQFDNPIETSFFKNYWVPIQKDDYDYFLDLSSDELPLFQPCYFFAEPYRWYKKDIINNLTELLLAIDNPKFNLKNYTQRNDDDGWSQFNNFFEERYKLGFAGKLKPIPVDKAYLFNKHLESFYFRENDTLIIKGINAVVIGLLPSDTEITLDHLYAIDDRQYDNVKGKIKTINALTYLLENIGFGCVQYYHVSFKSNGNCYAEFQANMIKIKHQNTSMLNKAIKQYEYFKNA